MMNEFEQAKKEYEQIPVPEELADRVQAGIRQGRAKRMQRKWKRGAGAVAACLVLVAVATLVSARYGRRMLAGTTVRFE